MKAAIIFPSDQISCNTGLHALLYLLFYRLTHAVGCSFAQAVVSAAWRALSRSILRFLFISVVFANRGPVRRPLRQDDIDNPSRARWLPVRITLRNVAVRLPRIHVYFQVFHNSDIVTTYEYKHTYVHKLINKNFNKASTSEGVKCK